MPLISRPKSINTYCLSKVWFKTSSINLRVCDIAKITSNVKSWLFSDQLEKPEEIILHRPRKLGGLGLLHLPSKALSLLITSFLETAIKPQFHRNLYHQALYKWNIEEVRTIPAPLQSPYYDDSLLSCIEAVKSEVFLNIITMSSGMWYRVLLENKVTHRANGNCNENIPCRAEDLGLSCHSWTLFRSPNLSLAHAAQLDPMPVQALQDQNAQHHL